MELPQINLPPADRWVCDNGLVVIHRETHAAPLVSVHVWFRSGSIHEGPWLGSGLSHFLEHMLFKGTDRRGPLQISREVHGAGGSMNAYTTYDRTVYHIDGPAESAPVFFDVLADMGLRPRLPKDEFARERDVILREIAMDDDDPDRRLFRDFVGTAFRRHPYRFPVIGHRELFEGLTSDDLQAYWESRYAPANAVVVVVGAVTPEHVRDLIETHFGTAPMRRVAEAPVAAEPPQLAVRQSRQSGDVNVTRGLNGYKIPGLAAPDGPALEVLAHILGRGRSSRLWQHLRENDRLVHHIESACWNPGETGLLWVNYTADNGRRDAVEAAIDAVIAEATQAPPPAHEVEKAVRQAIVGEVNAVKTTSGQAARLGAAEVVAGDLGYPALRLERLKAVTPEHVHAVATRYLRPEHLSRVTLESPAAKPAPITSRKGTALPDFSVVSLPNGARVLCQPSSGVPKVHLRLLMRGGPLYEAADRRGATGVLASLLTKDTARRSAAEVAETVEQLGGTFNEMCGNNTFGLAMEFLSADWRSAIDILRGAVLEPAFTQEAFETERDGQLASLQEEDDEVLEYGRRRVRARFFGDHPYAIDYLGRETDLRSLTLGDITALRQQLLVGGGAVMAVTGDFDSAALLPAIEDVIGQLPTGNPTGANGTFDGPTPQEVEERLDRQQAVTLQAFADVGIRSDGYFASEVLDECFSGMSSRLFQHVREEKGLAYYIASNRVVGLDCGQFTFFAGTRPETVADVETEIEREIERACAGNFDDGEIAACTRHLIVRKRQNRQSPGARAMEAALDTLYRDEPNAWRQYDARISALTPEQIAAHARSLFSHRRSVRLRVLPQT